MSHWTDSIAGDRMTVDQEFADRVEQSGFTSQEWGLIMTATELEIENADDADRARIVANTDQLADIMPEVDNVRSQVPGAGEPERSGGIVDSIKGAFGLGDGGSNERLEEAERLTQEYADELQSHLESKGKWKLARTMYREN
ncbi:MAG: DUF5799 family protein [Haloferacaceae archaeon]